MIFYLTGIDYNRAPLGAREEAYRKRNRVRGYLSARHPGSAVILYTCNRVEFYGIAKDFSEAEVSINNFQSEFREFLRYGYAIFGQRSLWRHLLRLAVGLESQIIGEPQIFQQLFDWHLQEHFPARLSVFVRKALYSAKDIRARSGLDRTEGNIATLVSRDLVDRIKKDICPQVVIAGTGKIAELFSQNKDARFRLCFASHRNYARAKELAQWSNGEALMLEDLPVYLLKADALVSATSSPHSLFDRGYFRRLTALREKPLYLYDLAVPRDIDPDAGSLQGVILNDMDSLSGVFDEYNKSLCSGIVMADRLIEENINGYGEFNDREDLENGDASEPLGLKAGRRN